jgi:thiol-disulfide isomerase/thioredoxin
LAVFAVSYDASDGRVRTARAVSPGTRGGGVHSTDDSMSSALVRAPELDVPGIEWLNVERPLTLARLRGRVVILDFWTYCCINCIHALETLRRIEETFPAEVVVVGVHTPKFTAGRSVENVRQAALRHRIAHPIAHDPQRILWDRYAISAWPTLVVIDPDGHVAAELRGEPDPAKLRGLIRQLLTDAPAASAPPQPRAAPVVGGRLRFPARIKPMPGVRQRWAIADAGHHQIVLLEDDGTETMRFGDGEPGFEDGPAATARFDNPQGLVCSADAIFVADTGNHAVRRVDVAERTVRTIAGTGRRGIVLAGQRAPRQTALASPWDLELDGAQVFIANAGTHQLAVLDLERGRISVLAGNGHEGLADGAAHEAMLAQPSALVLDDAGDKLYFADSETSSVRAVTLDAQRRVTTLIGRGLFEFGHVNGPFERALLQHPLGVAWCEGMLIVADTYNGAIRRLDLASGEASDFDDGFLCEDALCRPLAEPTGIWADGCDRILVADTNSHRIVEYRVPERRYRTWAE